MKTRERLHRFRRDKTPAALDITAFMNLMVILVPFLLITTVLSKITVLQLELPSQAANADPQKNSSLELEIVVRPDRLEVGDRYKGPIQNIHNSTEGYDLTALSGLLQELKARHPDKDNITLLLEPNTSYEVLIQVMDTVRLADIEQNGEQVRTDLFPKISIGDAPTGRNPEQAQGSAKQGNAS